MKCEFVKLPDGGTAIVCGIRRRRPPPRCQVPGCTRPGVQQCDFPDRSGGTCDKYLCATHAVPQGRGRAHCPGHPGQGDLFHAAGMLPGDYVPIGDG